MAIIMGRGNKQSGGFMPSARLSRNLHCLLVLFATTSVLWAQQFQDIRMMNKLAGAAQSGNLNAIKEAVEKGCNLESVTYGSANIGRLTLLGHAVYSGKKELVDYLISKGANLNPETRPLLVAVRKGDKDMVELLLSKGASLDPRDALMQEAVRSGEIEMVKFFRSKGCKLEADKDGNTPLHALVSEPRTPGIFYNNPEAVAKLDKMVAFLVKEGVAPNLRNKDGMTALHLCCVERPEGYVLEGQDIRARFDKRRVVAEGLVANGADVSLSIVIPGNPKAKLPEKAIPDSKAIDLALKCNHDGIIKLLLPKGDTPAGKSALQAILIGALKRGAMPETITVLLSNGADPNGKDKDGMTPVQICMKSHKNYMGFQMLAALVEKGADPNVKIDDATPLHLAVQNSARIPVLETLLANGADINAKDAKGESPLDYVRKTPCGDKIKGLFEKAASKK